MRIPASIGVTPRLPVRVALPTVRFNSTSSPIPPKEESSKTSQESSTNVIEQPQDPDQIAEEWISTIREMREEIKAKGYTKVVAPKSKFVEKYGVDPTPEQLAKVESLANKPIPLKKDPIVEHVTNMIMKDGKRATAQRVMAEALYIVRLQLRKDPVEVLKEVLDRMAPLMTIKTQKTRAAKSIVLPAPLTQRQRHRTAFLWLMEGAKKRRSSSLSVRFGEELIAAYEGKSAGYDKRLQIHKTAMLQRAYVKLK